MFRAVREMSRKPAGKVRIHDDAGEVICDAHEINARVTDHFSRLFNDPAVTGLTAFTGEPTPLTDPITAAEVTRAINKLNSGRASGHDDIPADLIKTTSDVLGQPIAKIFNEALQQHEQHRRRSAGAIAQTRETSWATDQSTPNRPSICTAEDAFHNSPVENSSKSRSLPVAEEYSRRRIRLPLAVCESTTSALFGGVP